MGCETSTHPCLVASVKPPVKGVWGYLKVTSIASSFRGRSPTFKSSGSEDASKVVGGADTWAGTQYPFLKTHFKAALFNSFVYFLSRFIFSMAAIFSASNCFSCLISWAISKLTVSKISINFFKCID